MPNYKSKVQAMSTSFANVLAANPNRKVLLLTNQDASIAMQVAFGSDTAYVTLAAGATLVLAGDACPTNAVRAKSASGTPNLTAIYG